MTLGELVSSRIKELRLSKNMTQEALADKAGMETTVLSRIERGQSPNIQLNTLDKIIKGLDVNYSTFFAFTTSEDSKERITSKLALLNDKEDFKVVLERLIDFQIEK